MPRVGAEKMYLIRMVCRTWAVQGALDLLESGALNGYGWLEGLDLDYGGSEP